jgi:hypothetical protein
VVDADASVPLAEDHARPPEPHEIERAPRERHAVEGLVALFELDALEILGACTFEAAE